MAQGKRIVIHNAQVWYPNHDGPNGDYAIGTIIMPAELPSEKRRREQREIWDRIRKAVWQMGRDS